MQAQWDLAPFYAKPTARLNLRAARCPRLSLSSLCSQTEREALAVVWVCAHFDNVPARRPKVCCVV